MTCASIARSRTRRPALKALAAKLSRVGSELRFCYEAGPCGYGIQRQMTLAGHDCVVVAPSLVPRKPGDRIKTDRRDAISLAKLHRADEVRLSAAPWPSLPSTGVDVDAPSVDGRIEIRAGGASHRAGRLHRGRRGGNGATRPFGSPYRGGAAGLVAGPSGARPASAARMALVAAPTLVAELGDITRFANPRQLMAYLGLVPSEHSSGATRRQGGITKAGNGAARRMLIEAAWSYRFPARISREQLLRQEGLAKPIRDAAWKAQERLCRRYRKLARAGKSSTVVTTAIARELAGFAWAIAIHVQISGA